MIIKHSDAKIDSIYTDKKSAQEDVEKKANIKEPKEEEKKSDERD